MELMRYYVAVIQIQRIHRQAPTGCFYLRDDEDRFVCGLVSKSRKALGDQIRCVRDVTAK